MRVIHCPDPKCGFELLLIPDTKAMGKAIQNHCQKKHLGNHTLEHSFCINSLMACVEQYGKSE
jgi:hypothetical protein